MTINRIKKLCADGKKAMFQPKTDGVLPNTKVDLGMDTSLAYRTMRVSILVCLA